MRANAKEDGSSGSFGSISIDLQDENLLAKAAPKRGYCSLSLREIVLLVLLGIVSITALVLAAKQTGEKQLPPFCLFAVGGGYLEGTAFPQEERLSSVECSRAIKAYLTDGRYMADVETVASEALALLQDIKAPDTDQVLVFDIDETVLSNMKEFERMKFGKKPYDARWEREWMPECACSGITGRDEMARDSTERNLKNEGFGVQCSEPRSEETPCYLQLDLRNETDKRAASVYKPERRGFLQEDGYTLLASFGDQWSDLTGPNNAKANFKLPNPMYYLL
ncbi:uncharacterized protein LOC142357751 [Convolutriloba macropyga]|uniref:uncharacterized protein LOC142357751 n=1 Tax=Convolutriloba macropyga TaxID=536237 RepID=UPI003F524B88